MDLSSSNDLYCSDFTAPTSSMYPSSFQQNPQFASNTTRVHSNFSKPEEVAEKYNDFKFTKSNSDESIINNKLNNNETNTGIYCHPYSYKNVESTPRNSEYAFSVTNHNHLSFDQNKTYFEDYLKPTLKQNENLQNKELIKNNLQINTDHRYDYNNNCDLNEDFKNYHKYFLHNNDNTSPPSLPISTSTPYFPPSYIDYSVNNCYNYPHWQPPHLYQQFAYDPYLNENTDKHKSTPSSTQESCNDISTTSTYHQKAASREFRDIFPSNNNCTNTGHNLTSPSSMPVSKRTIFSLKQLERLEQRFLQQSFLSREERLQIGEELDLSERQVMIWFQNRRFDSIYYFLIIVLKHLFQNVFDKGLPNFKLNKLK